VIHFDYFTTKCSRNKYVRHNIKDKVYNVHVINQHITIIISKVVKENIKNWYPVRCSVTYSRGLTPKKGNPLSIVLVRPVLYEQTFFKAFSLNTSRVFLFTSPLKYENPSHFLSITHQWSTQTHYEKMNYNSTKTNQL